MSTNKKTNKWKNPQHHGYLGVDGDGNPSTKGSPRCEILIRPHTIWSRSPIWNINPVSMYSYRFALVLTFSERGMHGAFGKQGVLGEYSVVGMSKFSYCRGKE